MTRVKTIFKKYFFVGLLTRQMAYVQKKFIPKGCCQHGKGKASEANVQDLAWLEKHQKSVLAADI